MIVQRAMQLVLLQTSIDFKICKSVTIIPRHSETTMEKTNVFPAAAC